MRARERPIFIIGVHRSGTTLLRFMLSSSPRIYIPPESDFIPRFFLRDPRGALSDRQIAHFLKVIFTRYRFVREWQGDPPAVDALLAEMPDRTPAGFLEALYGRYARQYGAVRWGDKTPIYTSYIDLIAEIFPQAQFVHIVRDGRDVALSMLEKWGHKAHFDIYFAARRWADRLRRAQASARRLGQDRFYELRYEDLVADPERFVAEICAFLDEPYLPQMAQPHLLGRERIQPGTFHDGVRQAPNTRRVGRWRQELSLADQRLFQALAGDLLEAYGYGLAELGVMPAVERARLGLLATKYAAFHAGRGLLQALGFYAPN